MKKYGILFDYNGVIVDDEHLHEKAMANVVASHGHELNSELFTEECVGLTDKAALENLQKIFAGLNDVSIKALTQKTAQEYQKLVDNESILYKGVKNIIKELSTEFELAIVPGSLRVEVHPVLEEEDIARFFRAVITAEDIKAGKPNPEGYLRGINELKIIPENIVVIEDTPPGVQAANAAGLMCIAVLNTVTRDELKIADKIIENIEDLTTSLVQNVISGRK